eukprot:CAMPEP_0194731744 /NCGR_PEP_ID=MMETSP0296-20130528/58598_1 /TAXON_ID=39354 /ORGANISM="Heterosigma akashiwo, Strain CCMP2393" /LENGTH=77 /DNA_ID=CAMNT_0039639395 /DNA_START=21 /DNA_END=252 /DNA_ORIENTATION=-
MMKKYGAENVRGSMFTKTQDALRIEQLQTVFNLVCEDENFAENVAAKIILQESARIPKFNLGSRFARFDKVCSTGSV